MPIIFICSVPFGGGERLARNLAQKLGYAYLSREDVVARANECGIPVGKLEVAMVKKPAVKERLIRLRDRYLAVATDTIAQKAAEGNLVYYGRAGHLLLPGVSHVLRVRLIPEPTQRVETAMQRIKLSREKAEKFLHDIDSDIRAWVHFVHGVEMDDPHWYDFMVNLENTSLENAATALCSIAQLPDYAPTPASRKAMDERLIQSRASIKLMLDERTLAADLTVRSGDGILTVTYMPRQAQLASVIPEVLGDIPGCREIRCTMASTNILWIQEEFKPDSEAFRNINELARRWGAAVELLRYKAQGGDGEPPVTAEVAPIEPSASAYTGGIEDDVVETTASEDESFRATLNALVQEGRSGGGQTICGAPEGLVSAINPTIPYSLVAVGGVFLQKAPAARTRLARDLSNYLAQRVKAPVVSTSDLKERLRLGPRQLVKLSASIVVVALLYWFVFTHQEWVVDVLGGAYHKAHPWVALLLIAVAAPIVAGLYGMVSGALLKLAKFE